MRHLIRLSLVLAMLAGPGAGVGHAASGIRDLLLLKEAGLSDDILIELIQSHGSVFHLKAADIVELHKLGLSERVISAMLATARKPPAPPAGGEPSAPAQPDPATLPEVPEAPMADRARVTVPSPTELPQPDPNGPPANDAQVMALPSVPMPAVAASVTPMPVQTQVVEVYVPVAVAVPVVVEKRHVEPPPPPAPVYWGYGGQKKPGSWDEPQTAKSQPAQPAKTEPAKPTPPQGGRGGI